MAIQDSLEKKNTEPQFHHMWDPIEISYKGRKKELMLQQNTIFSNPNFIFEILLIKLKFELSQTRHISLTLQLRFHAVCSFFKAHFIKSWKVLLSFACLPTYKYLQVGDYRHGGRGGGS